MAAPSVPLSHRGRDSSGFVTAETAVVLPALILVLAVALTLGHAAAVRMTAQDAAAIGARAAARGDGDELVRRLVAAVAPAGADVVVTRADGLVRVQVSAAVLPPATVGRLVGALHVSSEAVAADESVPAALR
jgi:hypothetical protein